MQINAEPCAEFDFSAMHPRLAYNVASIPMDGDPYDIGKGFKREHVKLAVLIAFNAADPRSAIVGTNPWSWASPAGSHAPMVLDIANTGVARGKIYLARQKGLPIPEGRAINAAGAPTTDPAEAIDGIILPMAQHKGYAIALMMDMLSGVLTGSGFGSEIAGPYQAERRSRAGQLMIALNIESMQPLAEFMRAWMR